MSSLQEDLRRYRRRVTSQVHRDLDNLQHRLNVKDIILDHYEGGGLGAGGDGGLSAGGNGGIGAGVDGCLGRVSREAVLAAASAPARLPGEAAATSLPLEPEERPKVFMTQLPEYWGQQRILEERPAEVPMTRPPSPAHSVCTLPPADFDVDGAAVAELGVSAAASAPDVPAAPAGAPAVVPSQWPAAVAPATVGVAPGSAWPMAWVPVAVPCTPPAAAPDAAAGAQAAAPPAPGVFLMAAAWPQAPGAPAVSPLPASWSPVTPPDAVARTPTDLADTAVRPEVAQKEPATAAAAPATAAPAPAPAAVAPGEPMPPPAPAAVAPAELPLPPAPPAVAAAQLPLPPPPPPPAPADSRPVFGYDAPYRRSRGGKGGAFGSKGERKVHFFRQAVDRQLKERWGKAVSEETNRRVSDIVAVIGPNIAGWARDDGSMAPGDGGVAPGDGGLAPGDGGLAPGSGAWGPGDGGWPVDHDDLAPGDDGLAPGDGGWAPGDGGWAPDDGHLATGDGAPWPSWDDLLGNRPHAPQSGPDGGGSSSWEPAQEAAEANCWGDGDGWENWAAGRNDRSSCFWWRS